MRNSESIPLSEFNLSDAERQTRLYTEAGVTSQIAADLPEAIERKFQNGDRGFIEGESAFYLNSSDSLSALYETVNVKGKKVLTVGGSGDFAQIFIAKGAEQVDVLDYSLPACFWNELKLVAAKHLDYESYLKLFGTIDDYKQKRRASEDSSKLKKPTLFDRKAYELIKERLSPQAQAYFLMLQQPESSKLFTFDDYDSWHGFARYRTLQGLDKSRTSVLQDSPATRDSEGYEQLQLQMQETKWTIRPGSIVDEGANFSEYDYVYMSNASYVEIGATASQIIKNGAKKVGFTMLHGNFSQNCREEHEKIQIEELDDGRFRNGMEVVDRPVTLSWYEVNKDGQLTDYNLNANLVSVDMTKDGAYYLETSEQKIKK